MNQESIKWKDFEYEHRERSVDWFWAVGIAALALAVLAVIYGNVLFAIFVIIGVFTLFMYAVRKPMLIEFELTNRGLRIDNKMYPYAVLHSFYIHHHEHKKRSLIIKSDKTMMPHITIPLPDADTAEEVHLFLANYLKEEEHQESVSEAIMDYFGF